MEGSNTFDVTPLEPNKTVEGNFALMELRNTSVEGGLGEIGGGGRRCLQRGKVRWRIGINQRADLTVPLHKASQRRQSKTSGMSAASL